MRVDRDRGARIHASPGIDVTSYHDYFADEVLPAELARRLREAGSLDKPLLVGELGVRAGDGSDGCPTAVDRGDRIRAKTKAMLARGVAGGARSGTGFRCRRPAAVTTWARATRSSACSASTGRRSALPPQALASTGRFPSRGRTGRSPRDDSRALASDPRAHRPDTRRCAGRVAGGRRPGHPRAPRTCHGGPKQASRPRTPESPKARSKAQAKKARAKVRAQSRAVQRTAPATTPSPAPAAPAAPPAPTTTSPAPTSPPTTGQRRPHRGSSRLRERV